MRAARDQRLWCRLQERAFPFRRGGAGAEGAGGAGTGGRPGVQGFDDGAGTGVGEQVG